MLFCYGNVVIRIFNQESDGEDIIVRQRQSEHTETFETQTKNII